MQQSFKQNQEEISKHFIITEENQGMRADIFLSKTLNLSRAKVQNLIHKQAILLNSAPLQKYGIVLKAKDILILNPLTQSLKNPTPKDFDIPILYEDTEILVLNKPANLIVHSKNIEDSQFTLVDYLKEKGFQLSNLGDSNRLGIVHRLDKNTSGAIVIAKNNTAHQHLSTQIKLRQMGRYYLCVITPSLKESKIIELPIIRHPKHRLKYITATNNPNAKSAKTSFFTIPHLNDSNLVNHSLIGAKLFTGRTHQIRVHLNAMNRHILGDGFYGYKGNYTGRILLHAHFLHLLHPITQTPIEIYAPIPRDMQDFLFTHFSLSSYLNPKNPNLLEIPLSKIYEEQ